MSCTSMLGYRDLVLGRFIGRYKVGLASFCDGSRVGTRSFRVDTRKRIT